MIIVNCVKRLYEFTTHVKGNKKKYYKFKVKEENRKIEIQREREREVVKEKDKNVLYDGCTKSFCCQNENILSCQQGNVRELGRRLEIE